MTRKPVASSAGSTVKKRSSVIHRPRILDGVVRRTPVVRLIHEVNRAKRPQLHGRLQTVADTLATAMVPFLMSALETVPSLMSALATLLFLRSALATVPSLMSCTGNELRGRSGGGRHNQDDHCPDSNSRQGGRSDTHLGHLLA